MINASRCREKTEGWLGRRRAYTCQDCGECFQVDTLKLLPKVDRICPRCKPLTHVYVFTNKRTGKDVPIRARDVEIATMKAWQISPNLTFKIPQPKTEDANKEVNA